jgi:Ca-activated chloride channel family protein
MRHGRIVPALAALALVPLVPVGGQPAGQTIFSGGTRTVAVYATVIDKQHRLVTDLDRSAFEVLEDGKPVDLTVFSATPEPITLAILLDSSGSMQDNLPVVIASAEEVIKRLRPDDAARIGAFGERTLLSPRFTSDHTELLNFLHTKVQAGGETPLWNAVDLAMVYLKDAPRRRVVLVFTDGHDTTTLEHGYEAVERRAEAEEVMIYAIGSWGADGLDDDKPDGHLRKLADLTGGGYFELQWHDESDLPSTFARVADELHNQYVLGFTPTRLDGKTHSIEVRVRRPGLTIRARRSYVAAPS